MELVSVYNLKSCDAGSFPCEGTIYGVGDNSTASGIRVKRQLHYLEGINLFG